MYFDNYDLIPNVGIKDIQIGMEMKEVEKLLNKENIPYKFEEDKHENTDKIPWFFLIIENYMTFYFVKNILWKIDVSGNFKGKLKNGIKIGMKIEEAKKLDHCLKYDDWEENYISNCDYLLEDNYENQVIEYIAIGIKEGITNDIDEFYKFDWIKRYTK